METPKNPTTLQDSSKIIPPTLRRMILTATTRPPIKQLRPSGPWTAMIDSSFSAAQTEESKSGKLRPGHFRSNEL